MSKLESDLERRACSIARLTYELQVHKLTNYVGIPDRLFLRGTPPTILYVEFKRDGKEPRAIQWYQLKQLKLAGFRAEYIDNMEDFIKLIEEVFGAR